MNAWHSVINEIRFQDTTTTKKSSYFTQPFIFPILLHTLSSFPDTFCKSG